MIIPYKLPLKDGSFREGFLIERDGLYGDVAPYSREAHADALNVFSGETPTIPSVKFAFDCLEHPLPELHVPVNALNTYRPGFTTLKIKVGHLSIPEARKLIDGAPPFVKLRLDFNRLWSLPKLLEFASLYDPDRFDYLEEPTFDFNDLLNFSKTTGFPVAVDESIPYVPYTQIPTLKALVVKPTILGFIPEAPPGVELIFSSAFESGIGVAHIARLASIHNPNRPHGLDPYSHFITDLITPHPTISEGFFHFAGSPCIN